jgi:hypothetical protein
MLANLFNVRCPGCHSLYRDIIENGVSRLLHKGLRHSQDPSPMPTPECVASYGYVAFEPCDHCCPQRFATCPACKKGLPGARTPHGQVSRYPCLCPFQKGSDLSPSRLARRLDRAQLLALAARLGVALELPGYDKESVALGLVMASEQAQKLPELRELVREPLAGGSLDFPATGMGRQALLDELAQHRRNLALLRQKKAVYAQGEEPLHLLNQLEHEEQAIQRIRTELAM